MPCSPMVNANFILLPGVTKEKIRESIYIEIHGKKRRANQSFRVASMKRACVIFKARSHRLRRLISFPYESSDRSNVYRSSGYRLCPFEKSGNVESERFFCFFRKYSGMIVEWSTYRQERSFERRLLSYFSRSFNFDRRRIRGRVTYH